MEAFSNMTVYLILLAVIAVTGIFLTEIKPNKVKRIIYVSVVFLSLILLSAFRYGIGNDYFSYINTFQLINEINTPHPTQGEISYEPLFTLLTRFIGLFTQNTEVYTAIYSICALVPAGLAVYLYSKRPMISCFTYVCFAFFYMTMNFTRQAIAVSIILLGWKFLRDRRIIPAMLIIIAAAGFHYSALLMIPIYFLAALKPRPLLVGIEAAAAALAFIFSDKLITLAAKLLGGKYEEYLSSEFVLEGLSPVYVILPVLIFAAVYGTYLVKNKHGDADTEDNIFANLMFYQAVIWIFMTKHSIMERFAYYPFVFSVLALPAAVQYIESLISDRKGLDEINRKMAETEELTVEWLDLMRLSVRQKHKMRRGKAVYALSLLAICGVSLWYNSYIGSAGFYGAHGVFPYQTNILSVRKKGMEMLSPIQRDRMISAVDSTIDFLLLAADDDYTVVVSTKGEYTRFLDNTFLRAYRLRGFEGNFPEHRTGTAVIAVSEECGEPALYERYSGGEFSAQFNMDYGKIEITSSSRKNGRSSIIVCGKEYSSNEEGMNIVVIRTETGEVIDSVNISSNVNPHINSHLAEKY